MKNKKTITIILAITLLILFSPNAMANYQMRGDTETIQTSMTTFADGVRNMEAEGQVMGLSETHNSSTLAATTASNNIDVHLTKNTEYGACLLLSASPKYGKQGSGEDCYIHKETSTGIATTTGNQYGVYHMGSQGSWEWVSGGGTSASGTASYLDKYYNRYSSAVSKPGDATLETANWHGATISVFATGSYVFGRGASTNALNGAFEYYTDRNSNDRARACAVCGEGF